MLAFMMWLLGLWTWFKAFISLAWFRAPPLDPASAATSVGLEGLSPEEGHEESALATFLSSLPDYLRFACEYDKDGFKIEAWVPGAGGDVEDRRFSGDEAAYREFLAAVASSKVEYCKEYLIVKLSGEDASKHLEEIVGALKSNDTIRRVALFFKDCSLLRVSECFANLLLQNNVIQHLIIYVGVKVLRDQAMGTEAAEQFAKALQENRSLKTLDLWGLGRLDEEGMRVLVEPLKSPHSVLQELGVTVRSDVALEHVGVMLATNTSLRKVNLSDWDRSHEVYRRGYTSLRDALAINRTLEELRCTTQSSMELKLMLEPLMPTHNRPQSNSTLTSLSLFGSRIGGKEGMDILVGMIRSNSSLLELDLGYLWELSEDPDAVENVLAILAALKTNQSLKEVNFYGCDGVGGYKVLGTMMDLLLENLHLTDIGLRITPLERSGDAEYVYSELKKREKMKLWKLVQGMANEDPKSGRVFLCGNPFAGKTTLRHTMKRLLKLQSKNERRLFDKFRVRKEQGKPKPNVMVSDRTHGIEVDHVESDGIDISIWDMAGQTEYHSFHDLVIPNLSADGICSIFLLTCNPMEGNSNEKRNISEIRSEIEYWLRFIASNTRRSWSYRPHVSIVMTHFDYWSNEMEFATCIEDMVGELRSQFEEVLEFDQFEGTIFKVNGEDASCACMVFDFVKAHLKQLLRRLPKTIKACIEVQRLVQEWNANVLKQSLQERTLKLPVLKWEEFSNIICKGVDELNDANEELAQRKKEFVATSLNDGGHILYHEEGGFIITNPHWFCHDIMGEFLHHCANMDAKLEMISEHGMMKIKFVKQILSRIIGDHRHENLLDEVLSMMEKLQICYKQDVYNIMIPSTLHVKCQSLKWLTKHEPSKSTFIGRRLACKDEKQTMYSPGFFTRLQVSFFNKFQNNNVGNSYELSQDVIKFICDGVEVIIEFKSVNIDILLKSDQDQEKMLEFLDNGIIMHVKDLLSNPMLGCLGVILVEHILRPECVQELVDFENRKDQYASIEELEFEVVMSGFEARHNWKRCGHLGIGYDKVKDLLGDKAWKALLRRRYDKLERFHQKILHTSFPQDIVIANVEDNLVKTSLLQQLGQRVMSEFPRYLSSLLWKDVNEKLNIIHKEVKILHEGVRNVDQKMDVVMKQMNDVLQMQERITRMQRELVHEVSSRIDDLMAFSVRMQESQVPKLAYLTEIGKRKLLTRVIPGLMECQLHLMCESRDEIHVVEDQQGCRVKFGTHETRTFVTIFSWGLKIATILTKIGAHVAGGMGGMVPDFGEVLQLAGLTLDTPSLLDVDILGLGLESLPDDVKRRPITIDDRSKAHEWLIEFLERIFKDKSKFYKMFMLKRVRYESVGGKQHIAWICKDCLEKGIQSGVLCNY